MRFTPFGKAQRFAWTPRKLAAAIARDARVLKRDQERYPLLAEQIQTPPPLDIDLEAQRRDAVTRVIDRNMRTFYGRVWREARRDMQLGTTAERNAIRTAWQTWTGPTTPIYFRYIVDFHTGVMKRRELAMREQANLARINLTRATQAQKTLELSA